MYTHEEFLEKLKNENPHKIHPIEKYTKMKEPIFFKCDICGHEWETKPDAVTGKNPTGCPECAYVERAKKIALSEKEFLEKANLTNVTLLEKYVNTGTRIKTKCNICGYVWDCLPGRFLYKKDIKFACPKCSKTIKKTQEEYEEEVNQKHDGKISIISEYTGALEPVNAKCNVCGYEWSPMAVDLVKTEPTGCPRCNRNDGWDLDYFNSKFKILNKTIIIIKKEEKTFTLKCDICGHEWDRKRIVTTKPIKCPKCTKSEKSFGEYCIDSFLKSKGIKFERDFYFEDLKDVDYLRYDFWIPSKNILIEFNGEQHYKPVNFGNISKTLAVKKFFIQIKHDYMKRQYARNHGIKIITYKFNEIKDLRNMLERDIS